MKEEEKLQLTLTTVSNQEQAQEIASRLLESRTCACVNIIPAIESLYWWEDKIERSSEMLLIIKSPTSTTIKLGEMLRELHPYQVPEIVTISADNVSEKYFGWILDETKK